MQLVLKGLSLLLTVALPVALVLVVVAVSCGLAAWHRRRGAAAIPKPRIEFVGFDHGLPFVEAADIEAACAAPPPAPQTPRDTLRDLRVLGY